MRVFPCAFDAADGATASIVRDPDDERHRVISLDLVVDDLSQSVWLTPERARDLAGELVRLADRVEASA